MSGALNLDDGCRVAVRMDILSVVGVSFPNRDANVGIRAWQ